MLGSDSICSYKSSACQVMAVSGLLIDQRCRRIPLPGDPQRGAALADTCPDPHAYAYPDTHTGTHCYQTCYGDGYAHHPSADGHTDADRYRDTRSHSHATGHSRPIHACARGRVGRQPNARSSGTPFFTLGHCCPGNVRVAYFHRLSGPSGHHLSALAVGQERVICTTELLSAG